MWETRRQGPVLPHARHCVQRREDHKPRNSTAGSLGHLHSASTKHISAHDYGVSKRKTMSLSWSQASDRKESSQLVQGKKENYGLTHLVERMTSIGIARIRRWWGQASLSKAPSGVAAYRSWSVHGLKHRCLTGRLRRSTGIAWAYGQTG